MLELLSTAVASALLLAAAPSAAPAPAPVAQAMILQGPVVAGVCVLSPETVVSASKVGQAASLRFRQLAADTQRELQTEEHGLAAQPGAGGKPDPARSAAFQRTLDQRNRELELTRVKVVQRISQQAQPLIAKAYTAHRCGILFRREEMLGGNPTNDLTPEVVRALDATVTALSFEREQLPASSAAPPPAG